MNKKILIVDDSGTTRAMIRRIIKMTGLVSQDPLEAADGAIALELMKSTAVDLVLADLNMPNLDGVEMIHRMRADISLSAIPVIIISARPDSDCVVQLQRAGVRGYLPKPFTPEGMRDVIAPILLETAGVHHEQA